MRYRTPGQKYASSSGALKVRNNPSCVIPKPVQGRFWLFIAKQVATARAEASVVALVTLTWFATRFTELEYRSFVRILGSSLVLSFDEPDQRWWLGTGADVGTPASEMVPGSRAVTR